MPIRFSYKLTNTNVYGHLLYRIHEKDAQKIDKAGLLGVLKKSVKKANKHLEHSNCNILVFADSEKTIPEEGIGGLSWGNDWIRIDVDLNYKKGLTKAVTNNMPGMIAHELHHARRGSSVGYGDTLGEALITEGLAQSFEELLYPNRKVIYAHYLKPKEIHQAWGKAQPLLKSKKYNHDEWFFGKGKLKRWTGYSLGYAVVQQYIKNHPTENPATLVDTPASSFLKSYQ